MTRALLQAGICLLLGGTGCGADGPIAVMLPEVPGAQAVLLSAGVEIHASTPERGFTVELSDADLPEALTLVFYASTLEALGLATGRVEAQADCARSCELVRDPLTVFSAVIERSRQVERFAARPASVPEPIARTLIPDPSRCSLCDEFDARIVPLPAPRDIRVNLAVSTEAGAVIGQEQGALYRIDAELRAEVICLDGGPAIGDGAYDGAGHLWVAAGRTLAEIDLSAQSPTEPCRATTSTRAPYPVTWERIAVSDHRSPLEAYLVADDGSLHRWTREGFEILGQVASAQAASVLWLGPGRAVAAAGVESYFVVEGGETRIERLNGLGLPSADIDLLAVLDAGTIAFLLSEGALVLQAGATQAVFGEGGWSGPGAAAPFRGGLIITFSGGVRQQFHPDLGFCEAKAELTGEKVFRATTLGERVILADILTHELDRDSAVGVLTPRPKACENPP